MTVREAAPGDAAAVASLLVQLGYPDNDEADVRQRLAGWAAEPHGTAFVAEDDSGVVVGVVAIASVPFFERTARFGRIVTLVVADRCRGKGIGRLLMTAAEDEARRLGCQLIEVSSANRRTGAHAFYRGLGYQNWADRSGKFVKDLVEGFSSGSFAARFPVS